MTEVGEIVVVHDDISSRLDELADLCEHWKKWRNANHKPQAIRSALVMICGEVTSLQAIEKVNGPRIERFK